METSVDLPGGYTAVLRDPAVRTIRQKRPLQMIYTQLGTERLTEITKIRASVDEEQDEDGSAVTSAMHALGLTETEWDLMFRSTDAVIYSLLSAWDLPQPLPRTLDEITDMPEPVYNALASACAKVEADFVLKDGFDVGSVEHPESPTGASADSTV